MNGTAPASREQLLREEVMLTRQAAILEDFWRKDEREVLEERCRILRARIDSYSTEQRLAVAGTLNAVHEEYLREISPESGFLKRDEFLGLWEPKRSIEGAVSAESNYVSSKKRQHDFTEGFGVFRATESKVSENSPDAAAAYGSKRLRTGEKERPPCLRCRILKKKCDPNEQCSHCPIQSYDNESDFWKVLGCFRGHLRELSNIFCPDFSRSTQRTLNYRSGGSEIINFVLTKSRLSPQKKNRILGLVLDRADFAQLRNESWDDISCRGSVSRAATTTPQDTDRITPFANESTSEDYEAAWSVLQAVSMDPKYMMRTEYNLFRLIRRGNEFSRNESTSWDLYRQAKRLLRQSVEIYLLERLCGQMASGNMIAPPPFDQSRSTPNTLVLVDLKEDMEMFLHKFEKVCAGRAKLTGNAQLACFYALLVFGVAKSMLIDTYCIRDDYENPSPWNEEEPAKITSAYKALVSVFCWSSKSDIILQNDIPNSQGYETRQEARALVRIHKWEERGFKGTKEFLLSLGSCSFPDGSYNGFFVQKFGFEDIPTSIPKIVRSPPRNIESVMVYDQVSPATVTSQEEDPPSMPPAFTHAKSLSPVAYPIGVATSLFTFVGYDDEDGHLTPGPRHGRRKGALDTATLERVREVRKIGACWNCWAMKVPCSEGVICTRCSNKASGRSYQTCNRGPLTNFTPLFFPEFLVSEFSTESVRKYIQENTVRFNPERMEVQVTWTCDVTMSLPVHSYCPAPGSIAEKTHYGLDGKPLGVKSLPIGIIEEDMGCLEKSCSAALEALLERPSYILESTHPRTSLLAKQALGSVIRFHNETKTKHPLIHDGLLLYTAICHIGRPTVFTEESTKFLLSHLHIEDSSSEYFHSRLLNREIKHTFWQIVRKLTHRVFIELEKVIRSRQRSSWPIYFTAMLILSICVEIVQILANYHATTAKSSDPHSLAALEDEPRNTCQKLDDFPFGQLAHIFHTLFRTAKGESGGLNPFRDGFESGVEEGFDEAAMGMVQEIRKAALGDVEGLCERSKWSGFEEDTQEFTTRNSGRLVAKFLLSFVLPSEK